MTTTTRVRSTCRHCGPIIGDPALHIEYHRAQPRGFWTRLFRRA